MEIKVVSKQDRPAWNDFVRNSKSSTLFHLFEWGEVLEQNFSSYRRVYLLAKKDQQVIGIFPIFLVKIGFFNLLTSMPLSYPTGIYGGPIAENQEILDKLIIEADKIGQKSGSFELDITVAPNRYQQPLNFTNFHKNIHSTHVLHLNRPFGEIFDSYKKETRSAVKQSIKKGLMLREAKHRDIPEYYEIYRKTMKKLGSNVTYPPKFFQDILHHICDSGHGKIFFSEYKKKKIGGVILLYLKDTVHLFNNVSDPDYLKIRPNNFLLHHSIKYGHENNFKFFDFGASSSNSLSKFKESWGAKEVEFITHTKIYSPLKKNIWNNIFNFYLRAKNKIPSFVFNRFYFSD